MSEPARFELVEGATFQLSDGSSVTVRDGQLELSDGRRLPMPAAGEAITVERTVTRPDGGTARVKHTIRLSEAEPVVETPARPFAGAGPGPGEEEEVAETVPAPEAGAVGTVEALPAAGGDAGPTESAETATKAESGEKAPQEAPVTEGQLPEVPSQDPAAPITPKEPTLMGVDCGRRSLREMLWGSIPESGFGEDEDEPKAPPKGLLNKSYSIKEEDESEHEDEGETHEEALESSENADESFEFVEGKGKEPKTETQSTAEKEPETVNESANDKESKKEEEPVTEKEPQKEKETEKKKEPEHEKETENEREPEKEHKPEKVSAEVMPTDPTTKVTVIAFDPPQKSESPTREVDDKEKETTDSSPNEPNSPTSKPEVDEEDAQEIPPEKPTTDFTSESPVTATTTTTASDEPADCPADNVQKPLLTRQEELSSPGEPVVQAGDDLTVRVGVPLLDDDSKPADSPARLDSPEESTANSESTAPAPGPRSDEVHHDLHLKLTPILRSLESDKPKGEAEGVEGERTAKPAPSEDRKGTVPPNTPAVVEDREGMLGADEPEPEVEPVSVPKVVSYYESISPRASPAPTRPRDIETTTVPKVIKFAVPMQPEKVYLANQEPEEMENTPIPRAVDPPGRVVLAPEPAAQQREARELLIPVRGTPDDLDPLSALAASDTEPKQPAALDEKPDEPTTPSTTPEKDTDAAPEEQAASDANDTDKQPAADAEKRSPPVYDPALFEPEPKRPLILTSEMVEEDAPPYEPGVHDARTLPIGRKTAVVTEQPPPFAEDERTDPRDPFLPDNPRPGAGVKESGWLGACIEVCCCCWAP